MVYLGLDLGSKTCGVSISDRTSTIASSVEVIRYNNEDELLDQYNWFKEISIYKSDINLNSSDNVLILQTCTKNSDEFILVVARQDI